MKAKRMDIQQHTIDTVTNVSSTGTYLSAGTAAVAGLTLNDWGVIVGICGVVIGLLINIVFKYLSYRLEKRKAGL